MVEHAISINNIPIRLTDERWRQNHDDMAGYFDEVLKSIEDPDYVIKGYSGAQISLKEVKPQKFLAVIFKEIQNDGFVITAYFTRKIKLEKEEILWEKKP